MNKGKKKILMNEKVFYRSLHKARRREKEIKKTNKIDLSNGGGGASRGGFGRDGDHLRLSKVDRIENPGQLWLSRMLDERREREGAKRRTRPV
jgi:hypothetical protein